MNVQEAKRSLLDCKKKMSNYEKKQDTVICNPMVHENIVDKKGFPSA
jgi:hypothetical protein